MTAADIPKYWKDKMGGELAMAVSAYIHDERLTLRGIALMRAYVLQWIVSPVWDSNPFRSAKTIVKLKQLRAKAGLITSQEDLDVWMEDAVSWGYDPL